LLDQHWSPEQVAHQALRRLGRSVAVETIYQALYGPQRVLERDARTTLRTKRPYRRPRRRGDERRPRFATPIRLVIERSPDAAGRTVAGHWEGDLIIGSFNRSAIGTLVERTTRYTMLVHLDPASRATNFCEQLITVFTQLPGPLRRSLTWDQGSEMCHHHRISDATAMPVFFCHAGHPWERPSNENTNGLLRDYFPKG
jgi:IS30 family transposase